MATLWEGRFTKSPAESLRLLNDSLPFDKRMYAEDIAASRAHVEMLCEVGLLTADERDEIQAALAKTLAEFEDNTFEFAPSDEDIHTAVERRVSELAPSGTKLHTGRSRNDQVATDLRLWTKAAIDDVVAQVLKLEHTLCSLAENAGDAYLCGYTHLQQAQPVLLSHHLLAHGWALLRDLERLSDARKRADVSPLGAGALAGSTLPLRPELCAAELGFAKVFDNSLDAVSDRDFVAETLFVLTLLGVHLSRIGEELVLWATTEFAFITLADEFSTGSSMMPQKQNPDVAELARAKAGRLLGNLTGLMATLKGLPLAYNKDLQEDKEHLFDSVDTVLATTSALNGTLATLKFNTERMASAASSPYAAATDLAEWLVANGMPFREAHGVVAELVRKSNESEEKFVALVRESEALGPEAAKLLLPGASIARRNTHGGTSPSAVKSQLNRFRSRLTTFQSPSPNQPLSNDQVE